MESIVSRDTIRDQARGAAATGRTIHEANPYPQGSAASIHWERDYLDCVHELEQEEALV